MRIHFVPTTVNGVAAMRCDIPKTGGVILATPFVAGEPLTADTKDTRITLAFFAKGEPLNGLTCEHYNCFDAWGGIKDCLEAVLWRKSGARAEAAVKHFIATKEIP